MSNIVADSGIRRGIRRIKPYVLNRSGRKPRARELFQARRAQIGRVKYPCHEQFVQSQCRDVYKTPGIFAVKQCLSRDGASAAFYYAITFRNVPANGRKSR